MTYFNKNGFGAIIQKGFIAGIMALAGTNFVHAQQDPLFTNYLFNTIAINPGYTGSRGVLSISGLSRLQWVGLDGAPRTNTLVAHTPFLNYSMGLGVSVVDDRIGPIHQTLMYVDYSYTIKAGTEAKLAFGLKSGIGVFNSTTAHLKTIDGNDQSMAGDIRNKVLPNVGAGVYFRPLNPF